MNEESRPGKGGSPTASTAPDRSGSGGQRARNAYPEPQKRAYAIPTASVERERVDWLWDGRIPLGSVSLLVGDPGLGKSLLACELAARVSREGGFALIATAEDSLAATVVPRLEAAQADLDRVAFVEMQADDGLPIGLSLPDDVDELEQLVQDNGASLLVVDPLTAHLPADVNSWRDQSVRLALAPLHGLAERQRCAVKVIAHLNKALSVEPLRRIGGSVGIPAAARSVLLLARDPDDGDNRRVLAHVKCNVGPLSASLLYELEPIVLPATNGAPEVETVRLDELGESHHQGGDLLGVRVDEEERDALSEAEDFLKAELTEGPRLATEVISGARKMGITEKTLRRGKKNARVDSEKVGPVWYWSLPAAKQDGQGGWPSSSAERPGHLGHLPANPHGKRDSDLLDEPRRGKVANNSDMATLATNGRHPSFGDAGYLDYVSDVHRNGHITTSEALELHRIHNLVLEAGGEVP